MAKQLPIGVSDFKELIDKGCTYVDKTLLVQEIVEQGAKIVLIPRLRRFGKTLNLSMLRYFFEKRESDTSYLFHGLRIWDHEKYRAMQGQCPVIFISLKDVKHWSWEGAFKSLRRLVAREFQRHWRILQGDVLIEEEKNLYREMMSGKEDVTTIEQSLFFLTECLYKYHKTRVVLLIDEYDAPVHAAYLNRYYDMLISFLRNWLSAALKDNEYLERGVLTGILRVAKESIFSGLNNVITFTILKETFQDKFGFLESEVVELLEEYGFGHRLSAIKQWYNGYHIGSCNGIYNPWSVLQCIFEKGELGPYWVNTSDNALVKRLITRGRGALKADFEELLKGGIVERDIDEGIVFSELARSSGAVWSLLLYSGYLTLSETSRYDTPCRLRIPNAEVSGLYTSIVLGWFEDSLEEGEYRELLTSLTNGDIDTFSRIFQEFMLSSASVFDVSSGESEKSYHAFVLGMLVGLQDRYEVRSNRESGFGRYDVMLFPKDPEGLGIIMEFKKISRSEKSSLETAVTSALQQIEEKNYAQELLVRGISRILYLGFAFKGKKVLIRSKFRE